VVSAEDSRVTVLALATNEELIVARRAFRKLSAISTPHTPTALCMEPLTAPRPVLKQRHWAQSWRALSLSTHSARS